MVADPSVAAAGLAVDLVEEYDGDTAYADAVLDVNAETEKPLVVLSNLASAISLETATRLRSHGVPVLEGTASGLVALRHLMAVRERADRSPAVVPVVDEARRDRWLARLAAGQLLPETSLALLADYGIDVVGTRHVTSRDDAVAAAVELGFPVVLKTDSPAITHKTEAGGVRLGVRDPRAVAAAYDDIAGRLGPDVMVAQTAPAGVELSLGIVRDAQLGPLVVVAAGGVLVELLADRGVVLPPVDAAGARRMLDRLRLRPLLDGIRGAAAADVDAVCAAVVAMSTIAVELGDALDALDVNPVLAGPDRCAAVDVLLIAKGPLSSAEGPLTARGDSRRWGRGLEDRVDLADRLVDVPGAGPALREDRDVAGADLGRSPPSGVTVIRPATRWMTSWVVDSPARRSGLALPDPGAGVALGPQRRGPRSPWQGRWPPRAGPSPRARRRGRRRGGG